MKREIKVFVIKCRWMDLYSYFFKFKFKSFLNPDFKIQKSNSVYPSLIDIHANTHQTQLQYTLNTPRKLTPNRYI